MDKVAKSLAGRDATGLAAGYSGTENLEVLVEARHYASFLRALIHQNCPPGAKVAVDFGAGIGTFSDALADRACRVMCVETDPLHCDALRRGGHSVVTLGDLGDETVDYIFTLNVLEHIAAERGTLSALAAKLRPDGVLLAYVPAFRLLWSSMDAKVGHVRRYTRASLCEAVKSVGLVVEHSRYADSAGYFATLAYKALRRGDGGINRTGLIAFDRFAFPVGRMLDRLGASLIFGKNVYCVARKRSPV